MRQLPEWMPESKLSELQPKLQSELSESKFSELSELQPKLQSELGLAVSDWYFLLLFCWLLLFSTLTKATKTVVDSKSATTLLATPTTTE